MGPQVRAGVVDGENDDSAAAFVDEELLDDGPGSGVQVGGSLVSDQDGRRAGQCPCQDYPACFPAGDGSLVQTDGSLP
jgi:hypothetical protein